MEYLPEESESEAQTNISGLISAFSSSFTCFSQNQLKCKWVKGGCIVSNTLIPRTSFNLFTQKQVSELYLFTFKFKHVIRISKDLVTLEMFDAEVNKLLLKN